MCKTRTDLEACCAGAEWSSRQPSFRRSLRSRAGLTVLALDVPADAYFFTFSGSDEGDEVNGSGLAEMGDNGILAIEIFFHNSDAAILKATRK